MFSWTDRDGDLGTFDTNFYPRDVIGALTVKDSEEEAAVYLDRKQAKKLRRALKRALRNHKAARGAA